MPASQKRRRPSSPAAACTACALAGLFALFAAGCTSTPDLQPPPFGPDVSAPIAPLIFFPTGLAVSPPKPDAQDPRARLGWLLVVNSNFNRRYNGGEISAVSVQDLLTRIFSLPASDNTFLCQNPGSNDPAQCDPNNQTHYANVPPWFFCDPDASGACTASSSSLRVAMIGSYGGPLTFDQSGVQAFTGSRDTNLLHGVSLDPESGKLSCLGASGLGVNGAHDCRGGVLDLKGTLNFEGPLAMLPARWREPSEFGPGKNVLLLASASPTVYSQDSGFVQQFSQLVALNTVDANNKPVSPITSAFPTTVAITDTTWTNGFQLGGQAASALAYDEARRRLVLGGCYIRLATTNGTQQPTYKCYQQQSLQLGINQLNVIRFVGLDQGTSPNLNFVSLVPDTHSYDLEDLVLGGFVTDPGSTVPRATKLYAVTRQPDQLVEMDLSDDPVLPVQVRSLTNLPISPARMLRLQRPAGQVGPELLVVSNEGTTPIVQGGGALVVYDTAARQVVGQHEDLGQNPYSVVQLPPQPTDSAAHLVVSVFGDCRLALIDIDYAQPSQVRLRGRLGSCPQ